jgi:hypothetical protein
MRIRFIAGQILPLRCTRCDAKRKGVIYRDCWAWRARFPKCGHEREVGLTKPMDVLEAEGLIET